MISREKCLEWMKEYAFDIPALINHAYQEGEKEMRERAAKVYERDDIWDGYDFQKAIKNLEIE